MAQNRSWDVGLGRSVAPYGLAGIGLSSRRIMSLDLGYGASFDAFHGSAWGPFNIFVEHRGVGLFSEHPSLVGVSIPD
jgi:hypothetical protein